MKKVVENINQILAKWDPIGVGEAIAIDEYKGYIPAILNSISDKEWLMDCLENILVNDIGLEYDSTNKNHFNDLQQICDKITQVYKKVRIDSVGTKVKYHIQRFLE